MRQYGVIYQCNTSVIFSYNLMDNIHSILNISRQKMIIEKDHNYLNNYC